MAPAFFPALDALYFALCGQADVDEAARAHALWLREGLRAFGRPQSAEADKLCQRTALPLEGVPAGLKYRGVAGKDGMHAAACLKISEALKLAEAQTVLLVSRWARDSPARLEPGWTPTDQQLAVRVRSHWQIRPQLSGERVRTPRAAV